MSEKQEKEIVVVSPDNAKVQCVHGCVVELQGVRGCLGLIAKGECKHFIFEARRSKREGISWVRWGWDGTMGVRSPARDNAEDHPYWYKVVVRCDEENGVATILDSFDPRFGESGVSNKSLSQMNDEEILDALKLAAEVGDMFEEMGWIVRR